MWTVAEKCPGIIIIIIIIIIMFYPVAIATGGT